MTQPPSSFTIHESRRDGFIRLMLTGDLDMAAAPQLDSRLTSLRAKRDPTWLDLSQLDFIDSTGLHLLVRAVGEARMKQWQLKVDPHVAPDVLKLLQLVSLDHLLWEP